MVSNSNNNKGAKEDVPEPVPKVYQERLKLLKKAQEYSAADEIPKAVEFYSQYLNSLALFHKVDEPKLDPKMFDQERDLAELFLISHAYWDLAKAYDRSPNLHLESIRCLDQFVKFTIGYKYQYVNSRTIKSFIKKRLAHNPKAFKQAYERIHIESKGCFISSELFGPNHPITNDFRIIKFKLEDTRIGIGLIKLYYDFVCPSFFKWFNSNRSKTVLRRFLRFCHSVIFKDSGLN